jgi:hypothetical protein
MGKQLPRTGTIFARRSAGSIGAKIAARFLPTERYQAETSVSGDVAAVLSRVYSIFVANGRIASDVESGVSSYPKISGVIGSGFFNMNPTVVHVEVVATDTTSTALRVTAAAKEGLIKQRSAEKAVCRVLNLLNGAQ